jgi:hypothetical protein
MYMQNIFAPPHCSFPRTAIVRDVFRTPNWFDLRSCNADPVHNVNEFRRIFLNARVRFTNPTKSFRDRIRNVKENYTRMPTRFPAFRMMVRVRRNLVWGGDAINKKVLFSIFLLFIIIIQKKKFNRSGNASFWLRRIS